MLRTIFSNSTRGFAEGLGFDHNTQFSCALEEHKNPGFINLNLEFGARLDTDSTTTISIMGVSPKDIDTMVKMLQTVKEHLLY